MNFRNPMSGMGLTTKDFSMGNPEDALTQWGDLSSSAMQGKDARNAAQKGKYASNKLHEAVKAIESAKKPIKIDIGKNPPPAVGGGASTVWNEDTGAWDIKYEPNKTYFAGSYYKASPDGELMTEMYDISQKMNAGSLIGLMPFSSGVGAGITGPSQTSSSNILPYGSYTLNDKGEKQYASMKLSPEQQAQREWEQASATQRQGMQHPLGEYGAYQKSLQITPDGRPIYH